MQAYTTVERVAGMFPVWTRGVPNQKPPDSSVQVWIDDIAGEINAGLRRRFSEIISSFASFADYIEQLPEDAEAVLEKMNRYGAATQLGQALSTFGVQNALNIAKAIGESYSEFVGYLDARVSGTSTGGARGKILPSGIYDKLFDPHARTESPRPSFFAIAGSDLFPHEQPEDRGMTSVFFSKNKAL